LYDFHLGPVDIDVVLDKEGGDEHAVEEVEEGDE